MSYKIHQMILNCKYYKCSQILFHLSYKGLEFTYRFVVDLVRKLVTALEWSYNVSQQSRHLRHGNEKYSDKTCFSMEWASASNFGQEENKHR
jgi:hypothetical protein